MSSKDVTKIHVGGHLIGIIGLRDAIERLARDHPEGSDEFIRSELVSMLSRENYIPESSRDCYGDSFLTEFKKFMGEPVDESTLQCLEIKVLGPGCAQCDRLKSDLIEVLSEASINAAVEHVKDLREISEHGVMATPALVINGKVMSVGSVPPKCKLRKWIQDSAESA